MNDIIKNILDTAYLSKDGHIASSLSILDILYSLYSTELCDESDTDRNRLILSKGHSSLGLYAILNKFNKLDEPLSNFCQFDSLLGGHPTNKIGYVEASTGSLGHGLPMGVGMALAYKILGYTKRIYVVIGDGELNEGSNWESLLLGSHHKLNNLICILDYNRSTDRAVALDNIHDKIKSFNWCVVEVDGHSSDELLQAFSLKTEDEPIFIIANTIKGKGIIRMENNPEWHHKTPNKEEYEQILKEINYGINI